MSELFVSFSGVSATHTLTVPPGPIRIWTEIRPES
jgi:hypothetical protein